MKILVVGATGELGSNIVTRLGERGHAVRAFVRPNKKDALKGVEIAVGDLRDHASIERAVVGVDAVVTTASSIKSDHQFTAVDRDGQLALVRAAKAAGVKTFVFVSASRGAFADVTPLMRAKRLVENAVRESGMAWANLQPTMFMDIWLGNFFGWDVDKHTAQVFGSGDGKIRYIATSDVAAFAVASLERPLNRDLPLGGPTAISQNDAVRVFEKVVGHSFKVKRAPAFVFKFMRAVVGPFSDFFATVSGLTLQAVAGDEIPEAEAVSRELGVQLTSVEAYVARQLEKTAAAA